MFECRWTPGRVNQRWPIGAVILTVIAVAVGVLEVQSWRPMSRGHWRLGEWAVEWHLGRSRYRVPTSLETGQMSTALDAHMRLHPVVDAWRSPFSTEKERFKQNGVVARASAGALMIDVRSWAPAPGERHSYGLDWRIGRPHLGVERYHHDNITTGRSVYHTTLRTPVWIPLALVAAWPGVWLLRLTGRNITRAKRVRQGCCVNCGYNLRSNRSGTCPECGTPAKRGASEEATEEQSIRHS